MDKQQDIKEFLEKIKQNKGQMYQGKDARVFVGEPEDKFVLRYLKKKKWMTSSGETATLRVFNKYAQDVNKLCDKNVQTPRIYTTELTRKGSVKMVQDKAPGQVMFLDGIDSAAGVLEVDIQEYFEKGRLQMSRIPQDMRRYLLEKMCEYNKISQQKLSDAPRGQYEKYAYDVAQIAMSPSVSVDFFCENFFYDEQKGITFIDLERNKNDDFSNHKRAIVPNVGRAIHIFEQGTEPSSSYLAPNFFNPKMREDNQKLNVEIVVKVIEAFKKMGALQKLSDDELAMLDRYAYNSTRTEGLVSGSVR